MQVLFGQVRDCVMENVENCLISYEFCRKK